jgi:hypothetical protein
MSAGRGNAMDPFGSSGLVTGLPTLFSAVQVGRETAQRPNNSRADEMGEVDGYV